MQTSVTFKSIDSSDNLRSYVGEKLDRLDKYLYNPAEAHVVLMVEKFRHIAEIRITGDRLNIISKEEQNDMYSAIDMALDKIETQIKKTKQKKRDRRSGVKGRTIPMAPETVPEGDSSEQGQVRIENIEYKPMDIEEAVMQMELVKDSFLVFTNSKTDRVNVLYRRKNDNFGLIQPKS